MEENVKAHKRLAIVIFVVAFAFMSGMLFSAWFVGKNQQCVSAPVNGVIATWCAKNLPEPTDF